MRDHLAQYRATATPFLDDVAVARTIPGWEVRADLRGQSVMVSWSPSPAVKESDYADGQWVVTASESPAGPFREVGRLGADARAWREDDLPLSDFHTRRIFYRVSYEDGDRSEVYGYGRPYQWNNGEFTFGVTWSIGSMSPQATMPAVRYAQTIFAQRAVRHDSEECLLYRPAWMTPVNESVLNPFTGEVHQFLEQQTPAGSIYSGIYCTPQRVYVQATHVPGGKTADQVQATMPYWPPPQEGDIIRTYDGELYEVSGAEAYGAFNAVTHYMVMLSELPLTHGVNNIALPDDHEMVSAFPRRMFASAANIEGFYSSLKSGRMSKASVIPPTSYTGDR